MTTKEKETNNEFAKNNKQFIAACEKAGIQPTGRQAGKWRRQKGAAYKVANS